MSIVIYKNGRSQPAPVVRPSIDEATLTFVRTIMESVTQPHPSQALALNAFSTAFQRWNPRSIVDIITPTDKATLDLLQGGVVTAGNASQTSDGAAFVMVVSPIEV